MSELEDRKKNTMDFVEKKFGVVSVNDLRSDGLTVRNGNKVIKLTVSEEYSMESVEEEIRKELKDKLNERITQIGYIIKNKLDDMSDYVSSIKKEYESKTQELENRLDSNEIMPNITYEHAKQGLSLSKGLNGSLIWMYQSIYWPKYINHRVIEEKYSKRLINHIILTVETYGNKVMNVGVKKPIGLEDFQHYHTSCWGQWKFKTDWETPDDIIQICKEAEVVLETINTHSLASNSPRGLMRVSTLENHSKSPDGEEVNFTTSKRLENIGVTNNFTRDNVWST